MADPVDPWQGPDSTPASSYPPAPPASSYPPAPPASSYPPAPSYPPPAAPASYPPVPQPPAPATTPATGYAVYGSPTGALDIDPLTGQPLSDKSKVIAGLLQLLPTALLGLVGIGRLYAGHTAVGAVQIAATVIGWVSFWCGFLLFFPFLIYAGVWLWGVIDGIVLLAGRSVDGQGRLLRT